MKGRAVLALVVAVAAGAACGSGAASEPGDTSRQPPAKPRLAVGALFPLQIRGTGFRGRELVTVRLTGDRKVAKTVRADRRGRFTASFAIRLPRCGSITVRAIGSLGSRVVYQVPRPDCREP